MKGMKVYILDLGYMWCDSNALLAGSTVATASNPEAKHRMTHSTCDAILIDHPTQGKILYDLGCHPDAMNGRWPSNLVDCTPYYYTPKQTLENQLALCGTDIAEIDLVVLSHMHLDHAGYLFKFPHTKIIVHRQELADAMCAVYQRLSMEGSPSYVRVDITEPVDEYTLVDGDVNLCEGIKLLNLPGHTDGHLSMLVELENTGPMFFCRDACVNAACYGPPVRASGFVPDFAKYRKSIERIREIADETSAMVVFGHDWDQFCKMKHAPDYYD